MQALPPQNLKAASKLIFTNGGFVGCHLFNSIHRIAHANNLQYSLVLCSKYQGSPAGYGYWF
ncbi:hypothetical protein ERO13_A07G162000v2 [Gossypium hirsutum]|uniref:Uncharacterized protein n=2 Tax=Gossypium TaxID=3633 RepID=A0A5D2YMV6_GOSMU|nr:hypothetical protein ERO13_A07G162000v2 [Gossypium hirsutum]TYI19782.1 hypothetical protein ES332_A07G189100v1 [Gossypium tomentosum]TYJ27326.1 hypothetical protein E1A91_A07G178600v1 [Gossypium mustelinum]